MTLTGTSARFELLANADLTSEGVTGSAQIGTAQTSIIYPVPPDIAYSLVMFITAGDTLTLDMASAAVTGGVTGANQVETATVVAASGITSNGTCNVVFTSADVTGSPLTVPVTLTTTQTTATLIAAEIRAALTANAAVSAVYTIGGTGATVTATRILKRSNDIELNIAIPAGLGITAAAMSADTTAGVGESKAYRINGMAWDQTDHEGIAIETATKLYSTVVRCSDAAGTTVDVTATGYTAACGTPFVIPQFFSIGNHPWNTLDVSFTPDVDATIRIDIQAGT